MRDMVSKITSSSEGCQPAVHGESFKCKIWCSARRSAIPVEFFKLPEEASSFCRCCVHLHFNMSIPRSPACISGTIINGRCCKYSELVSLQACGYSSGFPVLPCCLTKNRQCSVRHRMNDLCDVISYSSPFIEYFFLP